MRGAGGTREKGHLLISSWKSFEVNTFALDVVCEDFALELKVSLIQQPTQIF